MILRYAKTSCVWPDREFQESAHSPAVHTEPGSLVHAKLAEPPSRPRALSDAPPRTVFRAPNAPTTRRSAGDLCTAQVGEKRGSRLIRRVLRHEASLERGFQDRLVEGNSRSQIYGVKRLHVLSMQRALILAGGPEHDRNRCDGRRYLAGWLQFARLGVDLELHDGVALLVGDV